MKFLRRPELVGKTGLSYPTIYRYEQAGDFPPRRQLGPNSVGWLEHEVDEWMEARVKRAAAPEFQAGRRPRGKPAVASKGTAA
jgi:prophage regulatory protein